MKSTLKRLAAVAALTAFAASAGCTGGSTGDYASAQAIDASASVSSEVETSVETTGGTCSGMICESSAPLTWEPTTVEPTPEPTVDLTEITKNRLTENKWRLINCIVNGVEKSPVLWYGNFIRQTGAYMEFHVDDTFKCIMGFVCCEGTYTVDNEAVSVHITGEMDGSSAEPEPVDKYRTLDCNFDSGVISLDYCYGDRHQVINVFEKAE